MHWFLCRIELKFSSRLFLRLQTLKKILRSIIVINNCNYFLLYPDKFFRYVVGFTPECLWIFPKIVINKIFSMGTNSRRCSSK
jgi:hypothetical protein